jgi:hypothetical protein
MLKQSLVALGLAGLLAGTALAHHDGDIFAAGDIRVSHAWTGETSAKAHAVEVYLTIANTGQTADRLLAAEAHFAEPAVFQAQILAGDGSLTTEEVVSVEIAAGQQITFQPGGLRIVLNDVQQSLMAGDHFHLELTFAKAGTLEIDVEVEERRTDGNAGS